MSAHRRRFFGAFIAEWNMWRLQICHYKVKNTLIEMWPFMLYSCRYISWYVVNSALMTSSGSVSLNSHPFPVQLIHDWQLRSVRSSSRNCQSWMGPLPIETWQNKWVCLPHSYTLSFTSFSHSTHQCSQQELLLVLQLSPDQFCCLHIPWSSSVAEVTWRHFQTCSLPLLAGRHGAEQPMIECPQRQTHPQEHSPLLSLSLDTHWKQNQVMSASSTEWSYQTVD